MQKLLSGLVGRRRGRTIVAIALLAGVAAVASATALSSSGSSAASRTSAAAGKCGVADPALAPDPQGILAKLPAAAQANYKFDPYPVKGTPWSTFKGKKPPWKLGYISQPYYGSAGWVVHIPIEYKKLAAQYKKLGLVSSFQAFIPPDPTTATPAEQIAAFQQMVRGGFDGIFVLPISSVAMTPAVEAAGKAGIPVIAVDTIFEGAKYPVSLWSNNNGPTYPATMKLIKGKGNVIIVRGIAGSGSEQVWYDEAVQAVKDCPGAKVVGVIKGDWNDATAKTNILSFVAGHPGMKIDAALEMGGMVQGIMGAFVQLGGRLPAISVAPCSVGQLSYQLAHKSTGYDMAATCFSGYQTAWSTWGAMLRILDGRGPKTSYIPVGLKLITNANVASLAKPNIPLNTSDEPAGVINGGASDKYLDMWFAKPGTPGRSDAHPLG